MTRGPALTLTLTGGPGLAGCTEGDKPSARETTELTDATDELAMAAYDGCIDAGCREDDC